MEADAVDPEFAAELAIVAALENLDVGPDEQARERMLAKATPPPAGSRRSRFLVAAAAALVLVFALAGMSLLLSRDALPGDTLYGIKRTAEAASLGLTFGDASRALKHLEFANARVDEVETLAQRHTDPAEAPVGGHLTALTDFDADASEASRQLIALATRGDVQQLDSLRTWATQQNTRLGAVNPRLPEQVQARVAASRQLLDRITDRSATLLGRANCYQITTGNSDDVGALPATGACHRDTASTITSGVPTVPPSTVPPRVRATYTSPPPVAPEPTPPAATAPALPLVPQPPLPTPSTQRPPSPTPPQLPVPILELPPLLPGLPAIRVG
ncbi:hypothetical protein ALI144C_45580 [Actinosynnema sp. ALI-1.44]|nr:hypothetical protein ALI144C_45580 [Actinosynnema sp. ALI-1.44]